MSDNGKPFVALKDKAYKPGTAAFGADIPDQEEEVVGRCASIAKDKWVTALTVRHPDKDWKSYQYRYIAAESTFKPKTRFEITFVGDTEKYHVTVTGRNLEMIYNLAIQGRLEWVQKADKDFAGDGEPIILDVDVVTESLKEAA